VAGDGGLRQWQMVNEINHVAHIPYSFFAIKYVLLIMLLQYCISVSSFWEKRN
jgi:hypothetical protein